MRNVIILVALSLSPGAQVFASPTEDAQAILREVIKSREGLKTGQVFIQGHRLQPSITGKPFESRVSIKYEFDFPASLLRIDWDESVQRMSAGDVATEDMSAQKLQSLATSGKMQVQERLIKYVRTPQCSLHWNSDENRIVFQRDPQHAPDESLQRFDIRALGFMGMYDFENGTLLGATGKNLLEQQVVGFSTDNTSRKITWVFGPNEKFRREITIDQKNGKVARHFEVRQRATKDAEWEASPLEINDVTWKELSGAYVPATYVHRSLASGKVDSQLELNFEWKSVNAPLDENDFTYNGLDLQVKAQIVSDQSGKRTLVGYADPKGEETDDSAHVKPGADYSKYYGKEPPAFQITDALGTEKKVKLVDYRGKWLLLDFWSLDCEPCIHRDLPRLAQFYEKHAADRDRFEILAICATASGKDSTKEECEKRLTPIIENVWRGKPLPFPVLIDGGGKTLDAYSIGVVPTTILIDPDGKVVESGSEATLAEKLKRKPRVGH